uniref:Transposase n=1 Tax=Heterorhabditis bacteriophora TaxID=37862 RepID=A0A1I7WBL3_HETBA
MDSVMNEGRGKQLEKDTPVYAAMAFKTTCCLSGIDKLAYEAMLV